MPLPITKEGPNFLTLADVTKKIPAPFVNVVSRNMLITSLNFFFFFIGQATMGGRVGREE